MLWTIIALMGCGPSAPEDPAPKEASAPAPAVTEAVHPAAPAESQTYADGVAALCGAWQTCPNCADQPAPTAAFNLNRHIERAVRNQEVLEMFWGWGALPREQRGEQLQAAVERAGLDTCHIAIMYQSPPN